MMKVSYEWLKEFVAIKDDAQAVADRLSLSGLEVAAVEPAVPSLEGLVVGEVLNVEKHPDADKLSVCQVSTGANETHQIVCGALNVRAGMKAPVILPGEKLPDGTEIRKAKLRGVESSGMLCSARELGLSEDHSGLMDLPADATVGKNFSEYLGGGDHVIDIEITPNRGDCLGMLGVARDISALYDVELDEPFAEEVVSLVEDRIDVKLEAPEACPTFLGRVIRGIDSKAETPLWMRERLRRCGVRPISPIVDVTQYVMLELGQPMHGYDLREITGDIVVRFAKQDEKLVLLDGSEVALESDMLVIADKKRVLGLAGIMGGEGSGVRDDTVDIYLECAWFNPVTVNGRSRRLGVHTDAGYRFERGVDPAGQRRAIERATRLLLDIAGGKPGPVVEAGDDKHQPLRRAIKLRRQRLASILGIEIPDAEVERILGRLGMPPKRTSVGWEVRSPSHRFDIEIEEDLVEEVGRIYGYDHIPPEQYPGDQPMEPVAESVVPVRRLRDALVQRGYQEAVTYSFVPEKLQRLLTGESGIALANPITSDMTHMRLNLWAGLVMALQYNLNRQQQRVRIFETGMRFIPQNNEIKQENVISGLVFGPAYAEQWGLPERAVEFADVKGDVESLLAAGGNPDEYHFKAEQLLALNPGQSARIYRNDDEIGWLGALHPNIIKELELPSRVFVFELALDPLQSTDVPVAGEISRFPAIRRDLAILVAEDVTAADILATAESAAGKTLRELRIFDVYRGKGIDSSLKSIALSLILQDSSRTLMDEDVDAVIKRVASRLQESLGAKLRE
ncbi:MAG TPA: phenylalanine--tRNA ligase subunit beta [Gammaproteobacteria bacterium]